MNAYNHEKGENMEKKRLVTDIGGYNLKTVIL